MAVLEAVAVEASVASGANEGGAGFGRVVVRNPALPADRHPQEPGRSGADAVRIADDLARGRHAPERFSRRRMLPPRCGVGQGGRPARRLLPKRRLFLKRHWGAGGNGQKDKRDKAAGHALQTSICRPLFLCFWRSKKAGKARMREYGSVS